MLRAIINGRIITETEILDDHVLIFNETIESILPKAEWSSENVEEIIDAYGDYVSPGFIDVHIHGVAGCDTMDGTSYSLQKIADTVIKTGVTSILATTMTQEAEAIHKALANIRTFMGNQSEGANILGAHMEGPYISKQYKGAQDEKNIQKPDMDFVEKYADVIKMITFAPEVEGAEIFIESMKNYPNIVLSIGHSGATFKQASKAYENGVRHITHCFNAMSPLHHREPGVVGAALSKPFSCELICDNIHVSPDFYQGFVDIKGKDKTVLITDSMRAGCLKEGTYELGGQEVIVEEGSVRLHDGTLAGSVLTLNKAIKNVSNETSLSIVETIYMASMAPAKVIGIDNRKGSIASRKDADICIHDENMIIRSTFVNGICQYRSEQ